MGLVAFNNCPRSTGGGSAMKDKPIQAGAGPALTDQEYVVLALKWPDWKSLRAKCAGQLQRRQPQTGDQGPARAIRVHLNFAECVRDW